MFRGIFNRMYQGNPNRPDISPEDMPRNKFELFFTSLTQRFTDLVKVNLVFVLCALPVLIWTLLSSNVFITLINETQVAVGQSLPKELIDTLLSSLLIYLLGMVPCLVGPPLAGLTYVTRNWARDEHAWVWQDFKENMFKNWKQAAGAMLVFALVLLISFYTLQFYALVLQQQSWMWIMQAIFIALVALFLMSYLYVFPMMVTYEMSFGQLMKNGLLLALGQLPFTLLFAVFTLLPVVVFVMLVLVTPYALLVMLLYYLVLGFALAMFVINSYTNSTFARLLAVEDEDEEEGEPEPTDAVAKTADVPRDPEDKE